MDFLISSSCDGPISWDQIIVTRTTTMTCIYMHTREIDHTMIGCLMIDLLDYLNVKEFWIFADLSMHTEWLQSFSFFCTNYYSYDTGNFQYVNTSKTECNGITDLRVTITESMVVSPKSVKPLQLPLMINGLVSGS